MMALEEMLLMLMLMLLQVYSTNVNVLVMLKESQGITKVIRILPLGIMDICTIFNGNPPNSC